jgi:ketosteroid isomerase-like protein
MNDRDRRAAIEAHYAAAAAQDMAGVSALYHEDAVAEYPQSGERILGRANLRALRENYPATLSFTINRIEGSGDLWVTQYVIDYDGMPSFVVSIMHFQGDHVDRETLYFADPFEPPAWRSQWVQVEGR